MVFNSIQYSHSNTYSIENCSIVVFNRNRGPARLSLTKTVHVFTLSIVLVLTQFNTKFIENLLNWCVVRDTGDLHSQGSLTRPKTLLFQTCSLPFFSGFRPRGARRNPCPFFQKLQRLCLKTECKRHVSSCSYFDCSMYEVWLIFQPWGQRTGRWKLNIRDLLDAGWSQTELKTECRQHVSSRSYFDCSMYEVWSIFKPWGQRTGRFETKLAIERWQSQKRRKVWIWVTIECGCIEYDY